MRYATYNRKKRTVTWHDETGREMVRYFGVEEAEARVDLDQSDYVTMETEFLDMEGGTIKLPGTILITGVDY